MKKQRFWLTFLLLAFYVVIYEWIFHGGVLAGLYQSTASVWRPEEDMPDYMLWMLLGQILFAFVFCWLYQCVSCGKSLKGGACYGLAIGALMSSVSLIYYAVLPIPFVLLASWVAIGIAETVIAGAILGSLTPKQEM